MSTPATNWIGSPDPERRELVQRALNVAGAGSVLLQTFINRVVQMLTIRELGLQAVLDRRPGTGNAAYVNRRTPGSIGAEWVDDTDSATEDTGTYVQVSFNYKTMLIRGKVTRKLQATGRSYGDVLGLEISAKAEDFAEVLEEGILTGDTNVSLKQINGLLTLVNNVSGQVIANTSATTGDDLVLSKLDEAIDQVKGSSNPADLVIVGSKAGCRKLNGALQAQQQFNDVTEIAAGFRVRTYDGIPIVRSTKMPDTILPNASGAILTFTTGATTALAVVNRRYVYIEELTEQTVLPLAKDSSQYDLFEIYWDGVLVMSNTYGASLLTSIKPS